MFSMPDVLVIMVIVLIIFGPGKLPEIAKSLGKGIRDFKTAAEEPAPREIDPQKAAPAEQLQDQLQKPN